jgi:DNA-directed RNA polymerase specialized sigma24 family protein
VLTEAQICLRVDVQEALAQLGFEERTVLWLAGVCGWTMDEVGEMLGWSDDRCQRTWQRARTALRERLSVYRAVRPESQGEEPRS